MRTKSNRNRAAFELRGAVENANVGQGNSTPFQRGYTHIHATNAEGRVLYGYSPGGVGSTATA